MSPRALLRWSPIQALLAGITACNGIFDIEERAFDPDLSAAVDPACVDYSRKSEGAGELQRRCS